MAPLQQPHLVSHSHGGRRGAGPGIEPQPPNRSTGQDAVKVIKGELEQLLPDIKVFLDARTRLAALLKLPQPL